MSSAYILVVDDEPDIRQLVQEILEDEGYEVGTAENAEAARRARRTRRPDLTLLDIWMPDTDGITLLKEWAEGDGLETPVIMMSGHGTVETAVEATRLGAYDFIEKPLSMAKLLVTAERGLEASRLRHENVGLKRQSQPLAEPVGRSATVAALKGQLGRIAEHDTAVLLTGESGSGKEVFARYLHEHSNRARGPFISVGVTFSGGIDPVVELFGSEEGDSIHYGRFEQANGGTLFLNDIADMDSAVQARLLSSIEQKSLLRSGGKELVAVDVRIVAATSHDLAAEVEAGTFRDDLFYQLNVLPLYVPGLREHPEDVSDLLNYYVDYFVRRDNLRYRHFSMAAQNYLRNYPWPGNVRELINLVQRLLILGSSAEVSVEEVERALGSSPRQPATENAVYELPLREAREHFERAYLEHQLEAAGGNVSRASKRVGMERTHLYRKLKALGINPRRSCRREDQPMKVIILGAGQVGSSVAENLASEANDITMVDTDGDKLMALQDHLDIRTVQGVASHPDVLARAGAEDADMVLAVTNSDETNMIACQVAYTLFHTPTKIARVRERDYLRHNQLFDQGALPIDVLISPEQIVTHYIQHLIETPGALQVLDFADGRVRLVAVKAYYGGPLVGHELRALRDHMPGIDARVAAIFRRERAIIPEGHTVIEADDEVFFVAARENIRKVMGELRQLDRPVKRVLLAGGGNIGHHLARGLENHVQVKVIEHSRARAEVLSEVLHRAIVLVGDAADKDLLQEEDVDTMDVFCAVTDDDQVNILSAMLAKRMGARKVMALINRASYVDLVQSGIIDIAISPQQATIGSLLAHVRRGDVVVVHSLRRGAAEAIEAIAHGDPTTSKVVGRRVEEIKLPPGTTIGAVVRGNEVIIAHHDTVIATDDHVILFLVDKRRVPEVERLFQVSFGFL